MLIIACDFLTSRELIGLLQGLYEFGREFSRELHRDLEEQEFYEFGYRLCSYIPVILLCLGIMCLYLFISSTVSFELIYGRYLYSEAISSGKIVITIFIN